MDDRPTTPMGPPPPGERRLERPPSDRYREPEPEGPPAPPVADAPARGLAFSVLVAVAGAVAITFAGGVLTMTAGLLVIAAIVGWYTAVALRVGGAASWSRARRATVAIVLALAGIGLGQVGLWLLGREEGGVLTLVDYLGEVFGVLVPLQLAAAAVAAWLASR